MGLFSLLSLSVFSKDTALSAHVEKRCRLQSLLVRSARQGACNGAPIGTGQWARTLGLEAHWLGLFTHVVRFMAYTPIKCLGQHRGTNISFLNKFSV